MRKSIATVLLSIAVAARIFAAETPDWVIKGVEDDGEFVYFVGQGESKKQKTALRKAQADARTNAAEYVSAEVNEIVNDYVNEAGEMGNTQYMEAFESLSHQKSSALLKGMKQLEWFRDDEGVVWVLMSIPKENIGNAMLKLSDEVAESKKFRKNEAAAEANSMMKDAIRRAFGNGESEK